MPDPVALPSPAMSTLFSQPVIAGAAACVSFAAAASYATFAPRAALWAPVIWHGDRRGPARVAITFDDGPSPDSTPAVLDALGELGVRAAFFVVGLNAARAPALLRRIAGEGHLLGNHSFDHHHFGVMCHARYWRDQLARTDEVIEAETGLRPLFFRPPMGFKTPFMALAARQRGNHLVTWTRRALDGVPTTEAEILQRLAGRTRAGDIVAMHDGVEPHGSRHVDATVRAIRPLFRALHDHGITPVRLDEILALEPYARSSGPAGAPGRGA
jgi:peptidoglycan/xylan/chitin deacetylase (PgdA/CDA1 family)